MAYIKHSMGIKVFVEEICKLYSTIWQTKMIPSSWGHSKLVTLWKGPSKGKIDDPKTYRGLQIGSTLCKILVMIIISRIKTWYESQLLEQQQGFRSKRGTNDGIFIVKSIQQITSKMKKPAYALFIQFNCSTCRYDFQARTLRPLRVHSAVLYEKNHNGKSDFFATSIFACM